ncbi:MAG: ATP-binding cassette domain-containing protein [Lachnospiraceae bacterium]|nr:ATP-binding cassette domain-containing protein [Lachnospiraceae bacterium]MCI9469876.1 ATP-binding cassette domain-containing protein [Lachnospiraceae bacterium]
MPTMIETKDLTKRYNKKTVVDGLDMKVPAGSIYGFLGPNGAGKSTTMKMLLGLTHPQQGHIQIFGKTLNKKNRLEILKNIGSLIESPSYYGHLTGRENLEIVCTLKDAPKQEIDQVLGLVRMEGQQHKKACHYSLGMKQRLGLAAALLGHPHLLLLDEPTNGLDPAGIQEMRELICSLPAKTGMTILVSSHLLSEIDQMATHVGIIDKGQLIFQDRLSALHEHSRSRLRLRTTDNAQALDALRQKGIPAAEQDGQLILKDSSDDNVSRAIRLLVYANVGILRAEEAQMSLEDIFLNLTGRKVSL